MIPPTSIDGTDITGATIDGTDVQEITVDGQTVFSAVQPIDVYLEDDFNDNKLTNRTGTNTGIYNGVTGTFRPEYATETVLPIVSGGILNFDDGDESLNTPLNLNLSKTITWEFFNVDLTSMGPPDDDAMISLYASQITNRSGFMNQPDDAFYIRLDENGLNNLGYNDSNNNRSPIIQISNNDLFFDLKVTRTPNGNWEIFIDNNSVGTGSDTTSVTPNFFDIQNRNVAPWNMTGYKIS